MSAAETAATAKPASGVRWVVLTLLFMAMVINYVDRQTLAFLKPTLQGEFGWSETNYADIIFWFQATYAASYLFFGRVVDRIGSRWGFGIAFANGLFNAGTNIGAVVTPLLIPFIVLNMGGWREAFFIVGAAGLIWLPIWLIMYRRPREKVQTFTDATPLGD